MHPDVLIQVPRVNVREPFDSSRWNMHANWMNGHRAMHATWPDADGDILIEMDPTAKTVEIAGGAIVADATGITVTVPATFEAAVIAEGAVTLGDAAGDAITVNGTSTFAAPATFDGALTANAAVTLGNAAADALTVNATSTFVAPATFQGAAAFDSTVALGNAIGDAITVAGTMTWAGNGQRIRADFSNATVASRAFFQTSTTNGVTVVGAVPNGSGTTSAFAAYNAADPTNASNLVVIAGPTATQINSSKVGSGTALPLLIRYDGTTRIEADSTGIGFLGATPIGAVTLPADASDPATAETLVNDIKQLLIDFGLAT